jgi:hypothetical protein
MNESEIERFVSTLDGAYDAISLLKEKGAGMDYEIVRAYLAALLKKYSAGSVYKIPKPTQLCRVRLLGDREWPKAHAELGHPSREDTTAFGRCHTPRNPVLYASQIEQVAMLEVRASRGDCCVISTFTLPTNVQVFPVGEFDYWRRTLHSDIYLQMDDADKKKVIRDYDDLLGGVDGDVRMLLDAFMAGQFIGVAKSQDDYKLTSAYSDVMLKNEIGLSNPIDALIYPSVQSRHGLNFAVRADYYQEHATQVIEETRVVLIERDFGYGLYGYKDIAVLSEVNEEKLLTWRRL